MNIIIEEIKKINKKRILSFVLIITICLYLLACIFLFIFQERLIFHPQGISRQTIDDIKANNPDIEEINLKMKDGTNINGWFLRDHDNSNTKLFIYFGGNADEISSMIDDVKRYKYWSFVLINYRGYGESNGTANEKNLCNDALEIYDYFYNKKDLNCSKVVVMGRSIGSGVATYLAQNRKVDGIILATPYDSVLSVAQEKIPIFPVNIMLRNRFDSINRAPSIIQPALIIVASEDKLIPPWHARKLSDQWGGKVYIVEIAGEDHNSIVSSEEYWQSIDQYLKGL